MSATTADWTEVQNFLLCAGASISEAYHPLPSARWIDLLVYNLVLAAALTAAGHRVSGTT